VSSSSFEEIGKLILRLAVGVLMLFHGLAKISNGVSGIESMVAAHGLPAFFAWAVYIGEVLAPVLLILGLYARAGALLVVVNMIVAILLVHMPQLTQLGNSGGWKLELQGLFLFGALAIAFLGAGSHSLGGKGGRWN